ncbi:MAG: gluconokinase [Pedobacter sp.]|nr:MAG: gluconokinase [Pedobacter sp.]
MDYILGIDIGTGSTKAVALDHSFKPIAENQEYYPTTSPNPGFQEQDPELIWEALLTCIDHVVQEIGTAPKAIGFSSAMHSLIPVDKNCGPLSRMTTWADSRNAHIAKRLSASKDGALIYNATGTPIHAMSPLCKIIGMREDEPLLFSKARKFISIKEYIWFKLFGEYVVDNSIASCTGLFNIHKLAWDSDALEAAGISTDQLSVPVETDYTKQGAALMDNILPSLKYTAFVIGASDGCLANLGSHALENGTAALTIGTSGAVRIANNRPILDDKLMPFSYILNRETYICGGPVNNGGMVLEWLRKEIFSKENQSETSYDDLFEGIGEIPAGSDGLIFLPYLSGERAPLWDSESTGAFIGLTLSHTQAHMIRAAIEGVCFALNQVLQVIEQCAVNISQISVSGGFVQSKLWMQVLADVTGKTLVLVQENDASAIGAAYLAAYKTGYSHKLIPVDTIIKQTIQPDCSSHEIYNKQFKLFKDLYLTLKPAMHQLNQNKL